MTKMLLPSLCLLTMFAACGNDPAKTAAPGPAAPAAPMDDHGEEHALGQLTIGAHTFAVVQEGDVTPGKEAAVTLEFPADKALPAAVRVWFGLETGVGSMKARLAKEGAHALHNHAVVPKPLPEGSKLWIEVDENGQAQRASVTWHQ